MRNEMEQESVINGQGSSLNMLDDVDRLTKAGFEEEQAKAVVRMQHNLIHSHLATKRDIEELRGATKRDIADVKKEIKELENKIGLKMIIHSGGTVLTILTSLVTLAKLGLLTPM